jgi:hypothetical protein
MHEDIKTFSLNGEIDDSNLVETKERLVEALEDMIRDHGCVPVLDMDPQFTLNYIPDREIYEFVLTIYGVRIDEEKDAWATVGMMNGKPIMRYIPKNKSKES